MAEFCLDCFNRIEGTHYKEKDVTMEMDFCEGCGEIKPCVIRLYPESFISKIISRIRKKNK